MSKQPMGKTLLRNVIRHTDAHNKIQEEMDMWKMRGWEIQMSHHKHVPDPDSMRGSMHCDRVADFSRNRSRSRERVSEHDDRDTRYWTRKLYEFEASDPDRWGHSGFKELYPEEFESDYEKSSTIKKAGRHKLKKSKSDTEVCLSKRSKKSSRKSKKKKKKKKSGDGKRKKDESSNSDCSSDGRSNTKDKQRKKKRTKSRHKNKKTVATRGSDEDSSSEESSDGKRYERRAKKRKQDSLKDSDSELDSKKKKRKNWKAADEESSDKSSAD